jgi:hypothetical protein
MGATFGVQVPAKVDHDDRSEAQLQKGDRLWRGSVERIQGPTYRSRMRGGADQDEQANDCEVLMVKGRRRKSGGRGEKGGVLTWGDLASCLKGRRTTWPGARSQQRS